MVEQETHSLADINWVNEVLKPRGELAKNLGEGWYWAGDVPVSREKCYIIGGEFVPAIKISLAEAEALKRNGIIKDYRVMPVGREDWKGLFYQKGPNFEERKGEIGGILGEVWTGFSMSYGRRQEVIPLMSKKSKSIQPDQDKSLVNKFLF